MCAWGPIGFNCSKFACLGIIEVKVGFYFSKARVAKSKGFLSKKRTM